MVKYTHRDNIISLIFNTLLSFFNVKLTKSQTKQHQDVILSLGRRIVEIRKKRKMTQKDLAYSIGMEIPNLRQIEKGKRNVTLKTILLIAEGLDIDFRKLLDN